MSKDEDLVAETMRFGDGVFDVIGIFLTLALYVLCPGTWFN